MLACLNVKKSSSTMVGPIYKLASDDVAYEWEGPRSTKFRYNMATSGGLLCLQITVIVSSKLLKHDLNVSPRRIICVRASSL